MSTVIRPSGPQTPRVYWTRRLALLVVLVILIAASWWAFAKLYGRDPASAAAGLPLAGAGTESSHPRQVADRRGGEHAGKGAGSHRHHGSANSPHSKGPLPEPEGPCQPSDIDIEVVAPDSTGGKRTDIGLRFTSRSAAACTLAITPSEFVLRITSGEDVVWNSDDCPDELLAKQLVVLRHPAVHYRFSWNGRRSTPDCSSVGEVAQAGGYWAEAAVIGGDVYRGYFDVR